MNENNHVFSEILLHSTWHCHNDQGLITPEIESFLYSFMENYCRKIKGVYLKGVGGTPDHLHVVFQLEPSISISEFIGKIKGSASHEVNQRFGNDTLKWQRGYGVVSFSKRNLRSVLDYVANQKEHHSKGTLNEILERTEGQFEG